MHAQLIELLSRLSSKTLRQLAEKIPDSSLLQTAISQNMVWTELLRKDFDRKADFVKVQEIIKLVQAIYTASKAGSQEELEFENYNCALLEIIQSLPSAKNSPLFAAAKTTGEEPCVFAAYYDAFWQQITNSIAGSQEPNYFLRRFIQGRAVINKRDSIDIVAETENDKLGKIKSSLVGNNDILWTAIAETGSLGGDAAFVFQKQHSHLASSNDTLYLPRYYYDSIDNGGVRIKTVAYLGDPTNQHSTMLFEIESVYEIYLPKFRPEPLTRYDQTSPRELMIGDEYFIRVFPPKISFVQAQAQASEDLCTCVKAIL